MTAVTLDGERLAAQIRDELRGRVEALHRRGVTPGLGTVLVGDDGPSANYVAMKHRDCAELGIESHHAHLPADATAAEVDATVDRFNADGAVHAYLMQYPFPAHLDYEAALLRVDPRKDVDGLHPVNLGRMVRQEEGFLPCTPHGVLQMLRRSGIETAGRHVVMVGRSTLVGRPLANMLAQKGEGANATVTVCHTGTRDIGAHTRAADILIAAADRPHIISEEMVAEGAAVIDVGVVRVEDPSRKSGYRLVGNVDFDRVRGKASAITPVPGGVGPMTIAMLLFNTILAARRASGLA